MILRYINIKRDQYKYGYNISPDKMMTSALNKFKILEKDNKWDSMSPEQKQIVALAYIVEKLKENNIKLSKIFKTLPPGKFKGKGKGKCKVQGKKPAGKQYQYGKGKEEWKKQEPKDGEDNTKKVNDKTYFWCPAHQARTIRRPDECKIKTKQVRSSHHSNNHCLYTKPMDRALATILSEINIE